LKPPQKVVEFLESPRASGGAAVGSPADSGTWAQQTRRELEISWLGSMKRSLSREPYLTVAKKIFARVGNPTQGQRVQSAGEEGAIWLELAAMARGMAFSVLALEVEL